MKTGLFLAIALAGAAHAFSNPIFEGWYADPQIRRFGDTYWVFPTTSTSYVAQTHFDAFSSRDLKRWTKHSRILTTNAVAWAQRAMWAPDAHEKDGRYYIFFAANDAYPAGGKSRTGTTVRQFGDSLYGGIGVAVADRPEGPYRDLIGKPLVDRFWNRAQPIDQYVFKYNGGWYMIYGGWGRSNLVRLADDFKSLVPFEDGTMWRDMTPEGYTEGSVMFERKGRWYFMYSGGDWTRDDYCVNYSVGDTPFGPFKFKGKVLGVQRPVATGAGHNSVICVPGTDDWYICYHRRPVPSKGRDHRIVCIDRMKFNANGDIMPVEMTPSATRVAADSGATLFKEDGARTFAAGRYAGRKIMLPPDCAEIFVAVRMRTDGVACGKESWKSARTTMSFHDADGKMIGGWPECFSFEGTRGWMDLRRTYDVPRGAVRLDFGYGNYGSKGTAEFSDVSVAVVRFRAKKPGDAPLPPGAPKDPWSLGDAWKSTTATRARWCLNGLWGLRPPLDGDTSGVVPKIGDNWGWGKIPSVWEHPGGRKKEGQEVYLSGWLLDHGVKKAIKDRCWYRREFVMPSEAAGRRVVLTFTMLNTRAEVYVDGKLAGEVSFPGGAADITAFARPGEKQEIALYVTAFPLDEETLSFNAPDRADRQKAEVQYKGVTGDVYLDISPRGERIASATVECDVAAGRARFVAEIADARPGAKYGLRAKVVPLRSLSNGKSHKFAAAALAPDANGTLAFDVEWKDAALWDVHTPGNRYACRLELYGEDGQALDVSLPFAFGFRDVRIAGRDLLLNGTPIHLRGQVSRNMKASPGVACRESVREMCRRMKADGVNFLIADNYNFSPGGVSYFDAWLDVCDEEGMLVSFSLPHARDFKMKLDEPATARRYRDLAKWIVDRVRNHPCVIMYAMNHNAGGYTGDMNPLRIDGKYELGQEPGVDRVKWALRNRDRIRVARRIARELDPTRPAYHHESGNLDDFHTTNIYLNWAPVQERSDWLEHWNREGVKPLFFVEWGMPHIASWSSYRGPLFIHRNPVWQSIWASEFAAALRGDAAYGGDSPENVALLRHEEALWAKSSPPLFYLASQMLKGMDGNFYGILAEYMNDNWRSHRAWGITSMLPWDANLQYAGIKGAPRENPDRWKGLKRPGVVTDWFYDEGWHSGTGDAASYRRTAVGDSLHRWNMDDCAFIGGDGVFTDKSHHFRPGDAVKKALVILNDRRVAQTVKWSCSLSRRGNGRSAATALSGEVSVPPGTRRDVPVSFRLPPDGAAKYVIKANFAFEGGVTQSDEFSLESYVPVKAGAPESLLLYDTKGLTVREFDRLGVRYSRTECTAPLPEGSLLVVGRESLTKELLDGVLVPLARAQGRVLVFEQRKDALQSIGFRAQTYGLRKVFPRGCAALNGMGLDGEMLRDWNGESTIEPPYLENVPHNEATYTTDDWAGFSNTRVWRCRNRGCVATAIPEKPTVGDWLALADGGFDLQYAPLVEWRIGTGRIMFCQLDVTARTVSDPVADDVLARLVNRLGSAETSRPDGGCVFRSGEAVPSDMLGRVADGAKILCLGFSKEEVARCSPMPLAMAHTNGCYASRIEKIPAELDGLSNADWQWHGSMEFDAFTDKVPDGNAAIRVVRYGKGAIVFWQVPPEAIDDKARPYLRTSKRRAQWAISRIMGNIGVASGETKIGYADTPLADDDPYRYYRW